MHKIYKILNEIGCAKSRKAQYNILNVLFFTIAEIFSFKNFSIQIEFSNFARNKDKESENRILQKKDSVFANVRNQISQITDSKFAYLRILCVYLHTKARGNNKSDFNELLL